MPALVVERSLKSGYAACVARRDTMHTSAGPCIFCNVLCATFGASRLVGTLLLSVVATLLTQLHIDAVTQHRLGVITDQLDQTALQRFSLAGLLFGNKHSVCSE